MIYRSRLAKVLAAGATTKVRLRLIISVTLLWLVIWSATRVKGAVVPYYVGLVLVLALVALWVTR